MHKKQDKNFAAGKQQKREKRTRKSPKKAKPGAFWVLERMGTVENRGERMGKPSNRAEGLVSPAGSVRPGRSPLGCRPPRHALRRAQPCLVAKTFGTLTKNGEVSTRLTSPFLAGAEGLEPSARGFGVDVETNHQEQVRTSVARFLPQVAKQAVLVWCWEEIIRAKTGEKGRKIPGKAGNTLT